MAIVNQLIQEHLNLYDEGKPTAMYNFLVAYNLAKAQLKIKEGYKFDEEKEEAVRQHFKYFYFDSLIETIKQLPKKEDEGKIAYNDRLRKAYVSLRKLSYLYLKSWAREAEKLIHKALKERGQELEFVRRTNISSRVIGVVE